MITKEQFKKSMLAFCSIYQLDAPGDLWQQATLYSLNDAGITYEELQESILRFTQTVGVNEVFNKLPAPKDFLVIVGKVPLTDEQKAKQQAEFVFANIGKLEWQNKVIFDDATTNYVIENYYDGLSNFRWMFSANNERAKAKEWGKKDFIEAYVNAKQSGHEKFTPLTVSAQQRNIYNDQILNLGDEQKCKELLSKAASLALTQGNKTQNLIDDLSTKMKVK